jgi:metal iron transporter
VAGCALSIVDVLLILLFYRPNGTMKGLRIFELFVMLLVLGVVVCFCIQLSMIENTSVGSVFRGYLPSKQLVEGNAIYQACGILGATVMPHSLYLGSGIVQPRLFHYDLQNGLVAPRPPNADVGGKPSYQPSLAAIKHCMKYSIVELALSLFTFALFVNSAILIVAGASLYGIPDADEASLFSIYELLSNSIAPAAGTVFALALLLSGVSAGIVCTIAGQMVSEGALNWTVAPWLRRLITRSISVTPSIIIAGAVGKSGLTDALNGSQVALSVALPFISAPIIWFTARGKFMTVVHDRPTYINDDDDTEYEIGEHVEVVSPTPTQRRVSGEDMARETVGFAGREYGTFSSVGRDTRIDPTLPVPGGTDMSENGGVNNQGVNFRNHWVTTGFAVAVWLLIALMNVANLVLLGLGK